MRVVSLAFRTDLMVASIEGSEIIDRGGYVVVRTPSEPGYYWGNYLLVPQPQSSAEEEHWLASFAREFPDAAHVAIGIDGARPSKVEAPGFEAAGLSRDTTTVLATPATDPPSRPAHPTATVRPLTIEDDWAELLLLRQAVTREEGQVSPAHQRFLSERVAAARRLSGAGRAARLGAFVDGVLRAALGIVVGAEGLARYQNVETHPDYRRRGLAGWLVHGAAEMAARDFGGRRLVIVADPDGPGIGLYRSLGFLAVETQTQWVRPPA